MTAVWHLLVCVAAVAVCQQEKRETACGLPDGLQISLSCPPSQWIRVTSEQYSKAPADGSCDVGLDCRRSLSSFKGGLDVSCNGPVGDDGVCQEPTQILRWLDGCINGSERVAAQVRYECISGNDIMDMCSNETRTWTPVFDGMVLRAYLATPEFPNTPALSQHCTCNITGQDLWIQGLEVKADVGHSPPWLDVLTILANDTLQWSMQQSGGGNVRYLQEAMLIPYAGAPFEDASVIYQDYNLPGQLAWVRVQDWGNNLTITCSSVSVPPPPTTTTTTTTTPTPTTTFTPIPNTPATTSTTRTLSSSHAPTTTGSTSGSANGGGGQLSRATSGTPSSTARNRLSTPTAAPLQVTKKDSSDNSEDTGVVVGLCILVIVLIAVAVLLGFIIWRRYQQAKKGGQLEEGGGGFSAFLGLHYWFSRQRHQQHHRDPAHVDIPVSDFHNLEGVGQDVDVEGQNGGQYETIRDLDLRLQEQPSGGEAGQGRGEEPVKNHPSHAPAGRHPLNAQKHAAGPKQLSETMPATPSPSLPAMEDGSKSLMGTTGQRGLSSKQEKFVSQVLDQTLESIAHQREALTCDDPSPAPLLSPAIQSAGMATASERSAANKGSGHHHADLDLTKSLGVSQTSQKQQHKDFSSGNVHNERNSGENGVNRDDVYAKPIKRSLHSKEKEKGANVYAKPTKHSPLPKETGKKERSGGGSGGDVAEDSSSGAITSWTADVESSV